MLTSRRLLYLRSVHSIQRHRYSKSWTGHEEPNTMVDVEAHYNVISRTKRSEVWTLLSGVTLSDDLWLCHLWLQGHPRGLNLWCLEQIWKLESGWGTEEGLGVGFQAWRLYFGNCWAFAIREVNSNSFMSTFQGGEAGWNQRPHSRPSFTNISSFGTQRGKCLL